LFIHATVFAMGAMACEFCGGAQFIRSLLVFEMRAGPSGRRLSDLCSVIPYGGFCPDLKCHTSLFSDSTESDARPGLRLTEPTGEGQTDCELAAHRSSNLSETADRFGILRKPALT